MVIDDRVTTPDGPGIIIGYDLPESDRAKRYIVKLDIKKYDFDPCYWLKDLKIIKNTLQKYIIMFYVYRRTTWKSAR